MLAKLATHGIQGSQYSCPYVLVLFGEHQVKALVDSGSARSLISRDLFDLFSSSGLVRKVTPTSLQCMTAARTTLPIDMLASFQIKIEMFSWRWEFLVASRLGADCILGADFIKDTGFLLDLSRNVGYFKFDPKVLISLTGTTMSGGEVLEVSEPQEQPEADLLAHLSPERRETIAALCDKFPDVLTKRLGLTNLLEYKIKIVSDKVVRSHPYKLAPPKMEIMREMVEQLLSDGVIEPSQSNFASPGFLVPKPGGKSRLVIDYRKVNSECIEIDSVPLPDLHSAFDWFGRAKFFTILDLNSAYHQIPLAKESRPITSFCVPWNLYQFTRVPFGLATGAQTLTRLVDAIFHDLKFRYVFNYLDDLLVFSESWDEHVSHIEEVLKRLKSAGLTVNPAKVQFAREEISFLGHLVGMGGVRIDPERTQSIRDFQPPRDAKGIARFIGMVNFYRKFIPNVAEIAAPLNLLRRKGEKFKWGEEQDRAFRTLKEAILSSCVLRMPDFSAPFVLQTDASSVAIAAVVSQEVDGVRQPIAFASRTLSPAERKASIYELECLAVVFGMDKFRRYLEHKEFLLETDNQALSWLLAHPRQLGKIGRWVVQISSFKFKVQHIRGTDNVIADTLSRMFHEDNSTPSLSVPCQSVLMQFPMAFTDILTHQRNDPEWAPILTDLEAGQSRLPYFLHKGVLCCRPQRGPRTPKAVLPSPLIPMVFEYYHTSPVGGHLGIMKTIAKIRQTFIWKGMDRDIANRVRACRLCSLSKPAQNTHLGFLASEVAQRPLEKVFIDFVGNFPRSKDGNTMLLVAVDAFSKFVWLLPLRRATARLTNKALQAHIFQHFGPPAVIVSDNGSQFTSHEFRHLCFSHGIKHVTTSPYYPQPSHAERFNRNLRSALIAYHAQDQTSWDKNLKWLQMAFNCARHESHKGIPYELMFGHHPRDPLSNIWDLEDLLPEHAEADIRETWKQARQNLNLSQEKVRRKYNRGRLPNPFKDGDLVFCRTHPQSSAAEKRAAKLCYRWSGPHRIASFLTPVSVRLVHPTSGEFVTRAHISHLKPCRESVSETVEVEPGAGGEEDPRN